MTISLLGKSCSLFSASVTQNGRRWEETIAYAQESNAAHTTQTFSHGNVLSMPLPISFGLHKRQADDRILPVSTSHYSKARVCTTKQATICVAFRMQRYSQPHVWIQRCFIYQCKRLYLHILSDICVWHFFDSVSVLIAWKPEKISDSLIQSILNIGRTVKEIITHSPFTLTWRGFLYATLCKYWSQCKSTILKSQMCTCALFCVC